MLHIKTLLSLAYAKHCYEGWRYAEGRLCKAPLYFLSFMLNMDILLSAVYAKHFNSGVILLSVAIKPIILSVITPRLIVMSFVIKTTMLGVVMLSGAVLSVAYLCDTL